MTLTKARLVEALFAKNIFQQHSVGPAHRYPFRADETISPKRRRRSHYWIREIFCEGEAGPQGQKSTDWEADESVTEESGDFQVLKGFAGGNE
jgi:hypothetical protein